MAAKRIRRAVFALAIVVAPITVASASPASADAWIPRVPAGGCIYGIPVYVNTTPMCRIIGAHVDRFPVYSVD